MSNTLFGNPTNRPTADTYCGGTIRAQVQFSREDVEEWCREWSSAFRTAAKFLCCAVILWGVFHLVGRLVG